MPESFLEGRQFVKWAHTKAALLKDSLVINRHVAQSPTVSNPVRLRTKSKLLLDPLLDRCIHFRQTGQINSLREKSYQPPEQRGALSSQWSPGGYWVSTFGFQILSVNISTQHP